ncbi:netrin receptor UNC5C-like isoform X2 [Antedon mediterranea]|uniref:netrin receptor UNC5C-like isoform X2 n=1 Tax=Antedon mediterranea TaxID=105859 RepID=UPI003AF44E39
MEKLLYLLLASFIVCGAEEAAFSFGQVNSSLLFVTPTVVATPPKPVFTQQPQDVFIVKNKPGRIECKATPTHEILIKCNGVFVSRNDIHTMTTFDESSEQIQHVGLDIEKAVVEAQFQDYWCQCVALGTGNIEVESRKAFIQVAYLRRPFVAEPDDKILRVEDHGQLFCTPPDGVPTPEVYWEKDGEVIVSGVHYILRSDGLIINHAAPENTGNYTCVAKNVAAKRTSETASVTVYEDGGWSEWTQWTKCNSECDAGIKSRTRTCTNPKPVNTGKKCVGQSTETQTCTSTCSVNGMWTSWSTWSSCNQLCKHMRTRSCSSPAPAHGGAGCDGPEDETSNCVGDYCQVSPVVSGTEPTPSPAILPNPDQNQLGDSSESPSGNANTIALFVGIGLTVLVCILVSVFVISYFASKRKKLRGRHCTEMSDETRLAMLTMQPDLTHAHPIQTQAVLMGSNPEKIQMTTSPLNLSDGSMTYCGELKQVSPEGMRYNVPYEVLQNGNGFANGYSNGHAMSREHLKLNLPLASSRKCSCELYSPSHRSGRFTPVTHVCLPYQKSDSDCCSDRCLSNKEPMYAEPILPSLTNSDSMPSEKSFSSRGSDQMRSYDSDSVAPPGVTTDLPPHIDTNCVAWGTIGPRGGRLSVPNAGISVFVPEGAVPKGYSEELYITYNRETMDKPKLNSRQTMLTPIIICGPASMTLVKPMILTSSHCAAQISSDWKYSIYYSKGQSRTSSSWEKIATLGEETINTSVYCQLNHDTCSMVVDHLGWYCLVGEPNHDRHPMKLLQLAAFAPCLSTAIDYNIRIYVVDNTPDALESVLQTEHKQGGVLLQKPQIIQFRYSGTNLCLSIEEIMTGWRSKLAANYQEIPFCHIWSGASSTLHCSFQLERTEASVGMVHCRIEVSQGIDSNTQSLQITRTADEMDLEQKSNCCSEHDTGNSMRIEPPNKAFRICRPYRIELCEVLDPPKSRGNDWRLLAVKLGVDRYTNYFAVRPSPTDLILDLWEALHREEGALMDLLGVFQEMGRPDAVAVIEKQLTSWL